MKRLFVLCAAAVLMLSLCGCSQNLSEEAKKLATEAASEMRRTATEFADNETNRTETRAETLMPTETDETFDESEATENNMEEMIENGRVEDGDGNVGDLENNDGDRNIDKETAD